MRASCRACLSRARRIIKARSFKPRAHRSVNPDDSLMNQVEMRGSDVRMDWLHRPETVLLVKRQGTPRASLFVDRVAEYILKTFAGTRVLVEARAAGEHPHLGVWEQSSASTRDDVDFVVVAGGDGTMLHVSSLFQGPAPPVLSFNMGSFGFLTSFDPDQYESALNSVFQGGFDCTPRMRLACYVTDRRNSFAEEYHVLNDFALHRAQTSMVLRGIDCFVNDEFLTTVNGDGIVVASPSGSTAYSSSCGGSMVHPSIQAILLTPISPRSLSFRPILLPKDAEVRIQWAAAPEGGEEAGYKAYMDVARAHFDGDRYMHFFSNDHIVNVSMSPYPLLTINATKSDWLRDIQHQFMWNADLKKSKRSKQD